MLLEKAEQAQLFYENNNNKILWTNKRHYALRDGTNKTYPETICEQ